MHLRGIGIGSPSGILPTNSGMQSVARIVFARFLYLVVVKLAKALTVLVITLVTLGGIVWLIVLERSWNEKVMRHRERMADCRPRDSLDVLLADRNLTLHGGPYISAYIEPRKHVSTINARPLRNPYSQQSMKTERYVFCEKGNTPQQMPVTAISFYAEGGRPLVEAVGVPVLYPYHLWIGEAGLEFVQRPDATDTWAKGQGAHLFPTPQYKKLFAAGPANDAGILIDAWCDMNQPAETRNCVVAVRDPVWGLNYGANRARVVWDNKADAPDPDALDEIAAKLREIVELLEAADGVQ